jgi:WhiB family redox-sensing transcriptional regulator
MEDWRHEALCTDEDPELFFPTGETGPALAQIEQAKNVCRRCPVTEECLRWALDTGVDSGVWGGMSEVERRELKRRSSALMALKTNDNRWPQAPSKNHLTRKRLIDALTHEERENLSTN